MNQFVTIITLILSIIAVESCNITAVNDSNCEYAIKSYYGGSYGDCNTSEIIDKEILVLEVCIRISSTSSKIMQCVNGERIRNVMYDTSDCSGASTNKYDGVDEDECYDILCLGPVINCGCINDPCENSCTDRSDATCSFDCCDGIWYVILYMTIL